jgi:hypothetical protein
VLAQSLSLYTTTAGKSPGKTFGEMVQLELMMMDNSLLLRHKPLTQALGFASCSFCVWVDAIKSWGVL